MTTISDEMVTSAVVTGDQSDVFAFLGRHRLGSGFIVRVFNPSADSISIELAGDKTNVVELAKVHAAGLFTCVLPADAPEKYQLRIRRGTHVLQCEDPYIFPSALTEQDKWLFAEGNHHKAWQFMGAHPTELKGVPGFAFVVWAPNAHRVSLIADFNNWDGRTHVMRKHPGSGLWDLFIPGMPVNSLYKYEIKTRDGRILSKLDPYASQFNHQADSVAVTTDSRFNWNDRVWLSGRTVRQGTDQPLSIYEVHAGSWRRGPDNRYLTYSELSESLLPYLIEQGFTHLQLLPMSEYPFDGSWGYQPTGLFAPTVRYGTGREFKEFIQRAHELGVGVILDWVPGHFPRDGHALGRYDGSALYEHEDPRRGLHPDWDTFIFNYSRSEVLNYLISNALYWFEEFHVDGLRVDAVASMLYLDYSREEGQWLPNEHGGRENLEAIDFIKRLSTVVGEAHPDVLLIAEESTAWPGVSQPVHQGGLGFDYKWNMGWMHDTLDYMQHEPVHRKHHHHQMTFGLLYAFSEHFVLPLSHDEVVHGKRSLINKMPGDDWQQFANLRAYYAFMWAHPGRKLLFMGGEFAQRNEWNHDGPLDWPLLDHAAHRGVQSLIANLNQVYKAHPALHANDFDSRNFSWINADDHENSVYSFLRRAGPDGRDLVIIVVNFTPVVRHGFRLRVPGHGTYIEILNTDSAHFGGTNTGNLGRVVSKQSREGPFLSILLPPLASVYFTLEPS